jgi:hypothetical protein
MLCNMTVYICVIFTSADGVHAFTQVVSHWPVTTEVQVQSQASQCGTCGVKSGTGTFFFDSVSMIPPVFHILILIRLQTQSYQSDFMAVFMVLICGVFQALFFESCGCF